MSATSDGQLLDLSPRRKSAPTSHHEHGQVVAKFSDFHAFAVSGYLGDSTHNYCFVQVRERASSFPLVWGANLTSLLSGRSSLCYQSYSLCMMHYVCQADGVLTVHGDSGVARTPSMLYIRAHYVCVYELVRKVQKHLGVSGGCSPRKFYSLPGRF